MVHVARSGEDRQELIVREEAVTVLHQLNIHSFSLLNLEERGYLVSANDERDIITLAEVEHLTLAEGVAALAQVVVEEAVGLVHRVRPEQVLSEAVHWQVAGRHLDLNNKMNEG